MPGHLREFTKNCNKLGLEEALKLRDAKFKEQDKITKDEIKREAKQMRAQYEERFKD